MPIQTPLEASESRATRPLRVLLVDDEPLARKRMRRQLADYPDLEIVGECGDCESLPSEIASGHPDVLFLDIHMPGIDGLAFARSLPEAGRPHLVFVSAFEQHALHAFDVQAADYLLKPVSSERLGKAVERLRSLGPLSGVPEPGPVRKVQPLNRLVVPCGERLLIVPSVQVDWIESAGNYAVIHVGRDTHVLRETLSELEDRLAQGSFLRVSRSAIVNLDRVRELRSTPEDGHVMILADGTRIPITRGLREVQRKLETT